MLNQSPSLGEAQNLINFRRRAFELCLAIYRVTNLFPPEETLKDQLRQTAVRIIVLLANSQIRDTILKVEEMKIYLAIAKAQNWLAPINFDLLASAYSLLSDTLKKSQVVEKEPVAEEKIFATPRIKKEPSGLVTGSEMEKRQKLILEYINKNGQAKVSDLLTILNNVTERTIRNDLRELINRNLVKKIGSRKDARYLLI